MDYRLSCRILLPCLLGSSMAVLPSGGWADVIFARALGSDDVNVLSDWGHRYQHGAGVSRNLESAIRLYCKAAKAGSIDAQYYLGDMYAKGHGVKRDKELGAAWLHLAAAQNDQLAKRTLKELGYQKRPKRDPVCLLPNGRDAASTPIRYTGAGQTRTHQAKGPIVELARRLAGDYRLDPNLVLAVIEVESNFDPNAQSPKNAQGLMQLIPATAERFGVHDVWDPEQNMRGGMKYLRWLLGHFKGDLRLALAAYNAGEGAVMRYGDVPPFTETQEYVDRIMNKLAP
jgi:hypothetical protein